MQELGHDLPTIIDLLMLFLLLFRYYRSSSNVVVVIIIITDNKSVKRERENAMGRKTRFHRSIDIDYMLLSLSLPALILSAGHKFPFIDWFCVFMFHHAGFMLSLWQ